MAGSSSTAGSDASTDCTCNAGFTGPNGGTCTACGAGTYKAVSGAGSCSDCPSGTDQRRMRGRWMVFHVGSCLALVRRLVDELDVREILQKTRN